MDFTYEKAGSLAEALKLKAKYKEKGVFIAGGTDLLVDMRNKVLEPEPEAVIDISDLNEINYVRQENGHIRIGAGTRISEIQKSSIVQRNVLLLLKACREFANPLIKNRASLGGGNLINASPAADMATPLLILGAGVVLKSVNGERAMSLEEFFSGVKRTNHRNDELLAEIRFNETQGEEVRVFENGPKERDIYSYRLSVNYV